MERRAQDLVTINDLVQRLFKSFRLQFAFDRKSAGNPIWLPSRVLLKRPKILLLRGKTKAFQVLHKSNRSHLHLILGNQIAERDYNLALADERIARVGHQHVVEHQDVVLPPGKTHASFAVQLAEIFHD